MHRKTTSKRGAARVNKPDFTRYLDYGELTQTLRDMVEEHENLAKMYSIGKTYEGRDMWAVEITNFAKGVPEKKPGMYIDGNHHAGELTGSAVCLYTIWYLLSNYGKDPFVTRLVDDRTWYILPRISIDGAEIFLHTPMSLRSSTREYPPRDTDDGLNPEDIDGEGWFLQMRVQDPDVEWKVSTKDERLMVRREPWDRKARSTSLPGRDDQELGRRRIKMAQPKWGLDLNRISCFLGA